MPNAIKRTANMLAFVAVLALSASAHAQTTAPAPLPQATASQLGNVFLLGEPITLRIPTSAAQVTWSARDAWGQSVASGTANAADNQAVLTLPNLAAGYYAITLQAPGGPAASRVTVLPPVDLAKINDSFFGAMTHFSAGWDSDLTAPLARAGIKNLREELFWDRLESTPGQFAIPQNFQTYLDQFKAHHITQLAPLTFGHGSYDAIPGIPLYKMAPYTPGGFEAYARYGQNLLRLVPQIPAVEVWNEYNGGFAAGPADGKPAVYAQMLKHAYLAIKKDHPQVKVLAGSTIGIPIGWFEDLFKNDGLKYCDAISVHPYGYTREPESLLPAIESLRALIRQYNNGKDLPLWATEQGYYLIAPGSTGNRAPLTEHIKACYLVRCWVLFMANGFEKSFWYLARNDQHFGTMGLMGTPQDPAGRYATLPALTAYGILIRQLQDAAFKERETTPPDTYSYRFEKNGQPLRVLWSTSPADVALKSKDPLQVTDLMGRATTLHPVDGALHLRLSDAPLYLSGPAGAPTLSTCFNMAAPARVAQGEQYNLSLPNLAQSGLPVDAYALQVRGRSFTPQADKLTASLPVDDQDGLQWSQWTLTHAGKPVYLGIARSLVAQPLAVDRFLRLADDHTLQAIVVNASSNQPAHITGASFSAGDQAQQQGLSVTVSPGEQTAINLPIKALAPWKLTQASVDLSVQSASPLKAASPISFNPVKHLTPVIDADLSDWQALPAASLDDATFKKLAAQWTGKEDLSGWFKLAWDDQYLYFAAEVQDDTFDQQHIGSGTWKGDCFQLGIAFAPPWASGAWNFEHAEIGVALTPAGPEAYKTSAAGGPMPNTKTAIKRIGNITRYETALAWSDLGITKPQAQNISFGLFLNDADNAGRRGYLQWADIKRVDNMQPLTLQK